MYNKRHDEIIGLIENLIQSGQLKAGEKIPPERNLAEKFNVSRNTVREAIKALAEKAVLISRRGAGTFVAEGALACMIDGAARRQSRLREIFELRKVLEPQIARLAADRITDNGLAALEEMILQQQKAFAAGRDQVELDERFHRLIAQATGNSLLFEVYETLHDVLAESRVRELQNPERNTRSVEHHTRIVNALRGRTPERAEEMMRQHMEQVENNLQYPGKADTTSPRS